MMAIETDTFSERLVNLAPEAWARWTTGLDELAVRDFIHLPCRWLKSDRDILIQVKSPRRGEFLILNHWELNYNCNLGDRITAYVAMAADKYRLPVYPVLVNILRPSRGTVISNNFQSEFLGLQRRQDCRVINLWDISVEVAFSEYLSPLLPLSPVMKGGNSESVLRRAAIALEAENGFEDLEKLLAIFGSFVLGVELVERVMSLQAEALRASPWAATFKREGQQEGALEMLKCLIESRFGEVPSSLNVILPSLSPQELQKLSKQLLQANTLNEFLACTFQTMDKDC